MWRAEIRFQLLCAAIGLLALGLFYSTLGGWDGRRAKRPSREPDAKARSKRYLAEEQEVSGPWMPKEAVNLGSNHRDWQGVTVHHTVVVTSADHLALSHFKRGLRGLAYHLLILGPGSECDGCVFVSRRWLDQQPVPQTSSQETNRTTVAVAVMGDFDEYAPSDRQLASLTAILRSLSDQLNLPDGSIHGHGEMAPTHCPGQQLLLWLREAERAPSTLP